MTDDYKTHLPMKLYSAALLLIATVSVFGLRAQATLPQTAIRRAYLRAQRNLDRSTQITESLSRDIEGESASLGQYSNAMRDLEKFSTSAWVALDQTRANVMQILDRPQSQRSEMDLAYQEIDLYYAQTKTLDKLTRQYLSLLFKASEYSSNKDIQTDATSRLKRMVDEINEIDAFVWRHQDALVYISGHPAYRIDQTPRALRWLASTAGIATILTGTLALAPHATGVSPFDLSLSITHFTETFAAAGALRLLYDGTQTGTFAPLQKSGAILDRLQMLVHESAERTVLFCSRFVEGDLP